MILAPAQTFPSPLRSRWFGLRKFLVRCFWVAMVLAMGTVFWGLWYVSHRGFSRKWRQAVTSELEKRGVYLTVQRLTLDPLKGLVAQDVQLRPARGDSKTLAFINEVVLDINYSNLVHGEPFLNAAELHHATLWLPLEEGTPERKAKRLAISHLNARILLPPHHLVAEHAEAMVRGLRVSASGDLMNPEQFHWTRRSPSEPKESPMARLGRLLDTWDGLKIAGGQPALELRFGGDLAKQASVFVEAALRSGRFDVGGDAYRVESLQTSATLADGHVRVDFCKLKDARGALEAFGSYQIATGDADWQIRSSLDLPGLLRAVSPSAAIWKDLALAQPPLLECNGSAQLPPEPGARRFRGYGSVSMGRFAYRRVAVEEASANFSWDGPDFDPGHARWYLDSGRIRLKEGALGLNALHTPEDFRFTLDSRINPEALFPLLADNVRAKAAEWEFRTPPAVHLEGRGPSWKLADLEITGKAQLGATRARGVPLKSAALDLGFKGNVLTCQNIKLERAEGNASGTVAYDFSTDELRFQNVHTTVNPAEVVSIFDKDVANNLLPYRFKTRPALIVNGKVGCAHGDWQRNRLRVEVDGAQGMDYTFLKKELSASKISGTVSVIGDRLKLDGLDAALFGGRLRGKADISLRKAKGDYTAELFTEEIDFPALTKLYFDYDTSKGKLNGSFAFSGLHDFAREIDGKGKLHVSDGNVFAIPIFGPFSSILNDVLPGTGYNVARRGTCTFEMRDGVVTTDDLLIEGRGFSILGRGKLFVVDDKMDFTARINAQGLTGRVLDPISHLLEYVSDGKLTKPVWRPKRLPKMIFAPRGNQSTAEATATPTPAPVAAPRAH
ncbi:MAG: AsmA-like C-terminal region-containing protein [Chthoniobacteraceae bacterium]|nr:AsmA-like C-terminal region-containing protein [Chthoniobacteraceae bacterium]